MDIPFFSFEKRNADIKKEALARFEEFFDSQWYVLGSFTEQFEQDFAVFSKAKFSVGVGSGLDALHLSLLALGIGPGDEVIVPSNTYIASVLSISYTGARPVFVEPRIETGNMNPELIEDLISERTKCIMPVHLYGQACEMAEIVDIAKKHSISIVEDNAQAQGATCNGRMTGSFGAINATSFYPTKNLGALGEAGAITTDETELAEKVKVLRNYGSSKRYYNEVVGFNKRIDEFEAAYLVSALKWLPEWTEERRRIAGMYQGLLKGNRNVTLMSLANGCTSVYHLFPVRVELRDELRTYLANNGIGTQIHYPVPPHLQEAYRDLGYERGSFPIAERLADELISLPIYPGLEESQIEYICNSIRDFYQEKDL